MPDLILFHFDLRDFDLGRKVNRIRKVCGNQYDVAGVKAKMSLTHVFFVNVFKLEPLKLVELT